jgi:Zn finger protein HypA/HybF involved in hydrogenase expression
MDISPFGKTIAIILVVVLVFLFPLPYIAKAVNETIDDLVNTYIADFSDTARKQGAITKEMYEKLIHELDNTGELYDIDMEVSHPVSGIETAKMELGDKIPNDDIVNASYKNNTVSDDELYKENVNENEIQTFVKDNETVPYKTFSTAITVNSVHTHNADCYAGHRHSEACNQFSPRVRAEEGIRYDGRRYNGVIVSCPDCGGDLLTFSRYTNDPGYTDCIIYSSRLAGSEYRMNYSYGDPTPYHEANVRFTALYNTVMSYSVINPGSNPIQYRGILPATAYTPELMFGLTMPYCLYCHKSASQSCGKTQDEILICNQVVTSITATNPTQTVRTIEEFISTANATYLDNHTGVVNCSNNLNINAEGEQTVTLTYSGLVGNAKTSGTRTCTVNTTIEGFIQLTEILIDPLDQDVTRYHNPNFTVTAKYNDNSSRQVLGFSVSNYNSSLLGPQTVTLTYKESNITATATAYVVVKNLTSTCPICNTVYYLDDNDVDQGCPNCSSTVIAITASPDNVVLHQGDPLNITVEAIYANGSRSDVTDWTSNYDPTQVGIQEVTVTYQTFSAVIIVDVRYGLKTCSKCSFVYKLNEDGADPGCPVCKTTVVSIKATPEELTIEKHQSLPITVTATYNDGHTDIINDWSSNLIADTAGIYEIMILYQNIIDIIKVTILEDGQIECPYCGLKYLFNDSPKGCPSCSVTLTGIEASLRSGGTKVPFKSILNLQITKIFKDEHREWTYTGWTVSGYNPDRLGNQAITVHYEGFQDRLEIEVVDDLPEVTCPNGHTYYLNADGSDPGCPYCNSTEGKAEALFFFDTSYTNMIIDAIYTNGIYQLQRGDYLNITIKPRNVSILTKLLHLFIGSVKKEYTFGGEVS